LSKNEFEILFSAFCYRTLVKQELDFTDKSLESHIVIAQTAVNVAASERKIAEDFVRSVCLLIRDGLTVHFIHRSFQEYFAAIFLSQYRGENSFSVFDAAISASLPNSVGPQLKEINDSAFETEWALPSVNDFLNSIHSKDINQEIGNILQNLVGSVMFRISNKNIMYFAGMAWPMSLPTHVRRISIICQVYNLPSIFTAFGDLTEKDSAVLRKTAQKISSADGSNDNAYMEIICDEQGIESLLKTSVAQRLHALRDALVSLQTELNDRIDKRSNMSLLA
jgi:hypothetical protein